MHDAKEHVMGINTVTLDREFGLFADSLVVSTNYGFNSQGQAEKYIRGAGDRWYYLTSNGVTTFLYRWDESFATNPLIATFQADVFENPSLLHDAEENLLRASTVDVDSELGLFADTLVISSNYGFNSQGQAEKYIRGAGDRWYYLTSNGVTTFLYRWDESFATNPLIATFEAQVFISPWLLHDAADVATS